jgi:hypothetical protein
MTARQKGCIVCALQCALALSVAAKFEYDRATCPRVWVKVVRRDPELPIRGRYLALTLAPESGQPYFSRLDGQQVVFFVPPEQTAIERKALGRTGGDVWAEVTIPRSGPPRPIRLAPARP